MKKENGITLISIIIIIVIIIVGIIFISAMLKPQNGIGNSSKETKEWQESQDKLNKSKEKVKEAENNYYESLKNIK